MEDVLDLYEEPYDPMPPVVCFDESPKQLIAELHKPLPLEPGTPARYDTEYERNGICNLMMPLVSLSAAFARLISPAGASR